MIQYKSDLFGLRTLCMWNGSAAFRAVVPALFSTGLVLVYWTYWKEELERCVENTTTVSVMIGFFGFLLTTRLNFSYGRWWEAATMSHLMTSKLTDSALCLASFHYQSALWNDIKPQTFGKEYASNSETNHHHNHQDGSSHLSQDTATETEAGVVLVGSKPLDVDTGTVEGDADTNDAYGGGGFFRWMQQTVLDAFSSGNEPEPETTGLSNRSIKNTNTNTNDKKTSKRRSPSTRKSHLRRANSEPILVVTKSFQPNQKEVSTHHHTGGKHYPVVFSSQRAAVTTQTRTTATSFSPSDFLEEAVHLYSLLNAVAMASLRHDVEGCPSPLAEYIPDQPFPPYNPDHFEDPHGHLILSTEKEDESPFQHWWAVKSDPLYKLLYFLAGIDRSPKQRTIYNAARPFLVLGGVSELEARRLQLARGPMAQVALCQLWLKEFIAREYLHGSTGNVAPPIVGRVFHFMTDGMAAYHQCRKIAYVPFPFPHEQMTSLFTLLVVFVFPILYTTFVNNLLLAGVMNFTTMLCFQGIYEVARELSNPYHTVPNDLPLNRFHAQFNECLRTLMTGYHPDWKTKKEGEEDDASSTTSTTT
jgi:predicted membrane chloride channel (bestrophin family)